MNPLKSLRFFLLLILGIVMAVSHLPAAEVAVSSPAKSSDPKEVKPAASKPAFKRPPYNPVSRWKEDWSGLKGVDRAQTGDPFDPLKFIPLNADGSIWLSLGGGLRVRLESFRNFGFAPQNDDSYLLYHLLLHADLHITNFVRVFVEGIDAEHSLATCPAACARRTSTLPT